MSTKKPRLNVVLEPGLYKAISKLAKNHDMSLSLMARDLLKEAVERHEDAYWQAKAQERDKNFTAKNALPHQDIWDE